MNRTGQGQWALGYREPLNRNEQMKKDSDGLECRARIESVYAHGGFSSIDPSDLRGRFRWWGLYTQRKPGIPGGATGALEPEELEDEYFMLRVRINGGQLTSEQLRVIADVSTTYGRDVADVTDRQNIQLHWIRIEDVPTIFAALEAVGLSTCEACGDTPRVMLGCPLAGVADDEVIDGTAALLETTARYVGDPAYSNLPRKFKTAISGCSAHCTLHEINDVAFVGVRDATGTPGFDLWVGGGLSTNPKLAQRLGVFVTADEVPEVWAGVVSVFRDYGYRRSRNRARLKFLMSDWGPERFREVLETEYLQRSLPDGPAPTAAVGGRDHVGVFAQHDGRHYVGFAPRAGRTSGRQLAAVADLAERYAGGRVRTTTEQKLVILDVPTESVDALVAELEAADLRVRPSAFRRGTMACTGIEFCKLALVETKARAEWLYTELEQRLPGFDSPVRINVNGCPNSCARFQVADIGLMGTVVTRDDGTKVDGFSVHLGGHLGDDSAFGRKLRGVRMPAADTADYVERVLRRFEADRTDGEVFHTWAARAEEGALQ